MITLVSANWMNMYRITYVTAGLHVAQRAVISPASYSGLSPVVSHEGNAVNEESSVSPLSHVLTLCLLRAAAFIQLQTEEVQYEKAGLRASIAPY